MKNHSCLLDKATNPRPQAEGEGKTTTVWQGMTITFRDPLECYTYKEQFQKTSWRLLDIFNRHYTAYEFYPEFTDKGRIHYHGRYKTKSSYDAKKSYEELRKKGFIKIENIKQHDRWLEYILKQYEETLKLIDRNYHIKLDPIEYTRRQNMMAKKRVMFEETVKQFQK